MVKKSIVLTLALGIALAAFLVVWLQLPLVSNSSLLQDSYDSAKRRRQELLSDINDKEKNAFLAEGWSKYWTGKTENETARAVQGWLAFAEVEHADRLDEEDYRAARSAFEPVFEDLRVQLKKPILVDPVLYQLHRFESLDPWKGRVQTGLAVATLADSRLAEGDYPGCVDAVDCLLRYGRHLLSQGQLTEREIGLRFAEAGFRRFVQLLEVRDAVPLESWKQLSLAATPGTTPESLVRRALEDELAAGVHTFIGLKSGRYAQHPSVRGMGQLVEVPGIMVREERIYYNQMLDLLDDVAHSQSFALPSDDDSWFAGRRGLLSPSLLDFPADFAVRTERVYVERRSCQTIANLLCYQREHGDWPPSLSDLKDVPAFEPHEADYRLSPHGVEVIFILNPEALLGESVPPSTHHFVVKDDRLVYRFPTPLSAPQGDSPDSENGAE